MLAPMRCLFAALILVFIDCGSSSMPGTKCAAAGGTCIDDAVDCEAGKCVSSCIQMAASGDQDCNGDGVTCCLSF
jgi:hypothetical protein